MRELVRRVCSAGAFARHVRREDLSKLPLLKSQTGVQGVSTFPGAKGATNWWSPSYDRDLDLVFVPVLEEGMVFFPSAQTLPTTGGRSFFTAIRALDASTGKVVWEHRQETRSDDDNTAGLMSTSGGVVFGADHYGKGGIDVLLLLG